MKINGNQIRPGMVLEHQGRLWRVAKISHTQPGKGGAYTQAEMKDIVSGTKLNERFRSSETVERARLEQVEMQFLYDDGDTLNFMNNQNYEQVSLAYDMVGDAKVWLQENMNVQIEFYEDKPIGIELPEKIVMEITEAEATVKGQTQSSSFKPAVVENGETVMVPQFISSGERIVVNTTDGSYVERAKA
ncbi:MAG: elongation factor P [Pseudomonadota bacterium]|nr:elongation factor P [Pseudomonadota bacterium]